MPASAPQELPRGSRGSLAETNRPSGSVYTLPYHFCYPLVRAFFSPPRILAQPIAIPFSFHFDRPISPSFFERRYFVSFSLSLFFNDVRKERNLSGSELTRSREIFLAGVRRECVRRLRIPKRGSRRKRVSNIHVAEHVSGNKPLSRRTLRSSPIITQGGLTNRGRLTAHVPTLPLVTASN